LILFLFFCAIFLHASCQRRKGSRRKADNEGSLRGLGGDSRRGRQGGRTTVVSCRVFRKGVCKKTSKNIILVNKSIANSVKCQQFCYATQGCAAFTHFEQTKVEDKKCVLFRDCNGKLSDCRDCISGPIMPRVTECLAGRQEIETETPEPAVEEDYEDYTDYFAEDESIIDEEYEEYLANYDTEDYYETALGDDNLEDRNNDFEESDNTEKEVQIDFPLEEDALEEDEEEQEEVDINIDDGFLKDSKGNSVEIPDIKPRSNLPVGGPTSGNTFIFYFCALGGLNHGGAVNDVDIINTGLGNSATSLNIAPLPGSLLQGGSTSSAYTEGTITTCSQGFTLLTPYGWVYKPGRCFDYSLEDNSWLNTGARLTSYRKGATITKLGRYLIAAGGYMENSPLSTIEIFDPRKPKSGWKKAEKLTMPTAVAEHCTVTLRGRKGKEVVLTGGRGREKRVLKLDVSTKRWYSLNRLDTGRRNHACVKADLNGRPGLVVSGGSNKAGPNITSVEFYDAKTGSWLSMPSLRKGRQGHVMTVTKGRLLVAGGERVGRGGKQFLDDIEMFNGQRWVTTKQKMDRPRTNFSLVKLPKRNKSRSKSRGRKTKTTK